MTRRSRGSASSSTGAGEQARRAAGSRGPRIPPTPHPRAAHPPHPHPPRLPPPQAPLLPLHVRPLRHALPHAPPGAPALRRHPLLGAAGQVRRGGPAAGRRGLPAGDGRAHAGRGRAGRRPARGRAHALPPAPLALRHQLLRHDRRPRARRRRGRPPHGAGACGAQGGAGAPAVRRTARTRGAPAVRRTAPHPPTPHAPPQMFGGARIQEVIRSRFYCATGEWLAAFQVRGGGGGCLAGARRLDGMPRGGRGGVGEWLRASARAPGSVAHCPPPPPPPPRSATTPPSCPTRRSSWRCATRAAPGRRSSCRTRPSSRWCAGRSRRSR